VPHNYPLDKLEPGLNENAFYDPTNFTYPAGSYVCEVEVDPATGKTRSTASWRSTTSATSSTR
jgi:aerobic carbon-monoxide dehydrogenase large subunit